MRRAQAVVLTLALAVIPTACDASSNKSSTGAGSSGTASASSASAPEQGSGGTSTAATTATAADASALNSAVLSAAKDRRTVKVRMTGTGENVTTDGAGVLRYTDTGVEMSFRMKTPGAGGEVSMIVLGDGAYLKMPSDQRLGAKPWLKIGKSGDDPVSKLFGSLIDTARNSASVDAITEQAGQAGSIRSTAPDTVDGVTATRYELSVDVAKAADTVKDKMIKTGFRTMVEQGVKAVDTTLWVDGDNLPIKVVTEQPTLGAQGSTSRVRMTIRYSDWGAPVEITAPSPSEVGELGK
jgi:hypothetical protein